MDVNEYQEAVDEVRRMETKRDKSKGALSQLLKDLKKEFGVSSLEEGNQLLAKLDKEAVAAEEEADEALATFREEMKNVNRGNASHDQSGDDEVSDSERDRPSRKKTINRRPWNSRNG